MDQITPKNCSKCGAAFGCGVSSTSGCWCADLPHLELAGGLAGAPSAASDLDCICPKCLSEAIGQAAENENKASYSLGPQAPIPAPLIENEDFYLEGPTMVFNARFLLRRGYCCESGCRHCPY